jgi:hypothetical protein
MTHYWEMYEAKETGNFHPIYPAVCLPAVCTRGREDCRCDIHSSVDRRMSQRGGRRVIEDRLSLRQLHALTPSQAFDNVP